MVQCSQIGDEEKRSLLEFSENFYKEIVQI